MSCGVQFINDFLLIVDEWQNGVNFKEEVDEIAPILSKALEDAHEKKEVVDILWYESEGESIHRRKSPSVSARKPFQMCWLYHEDESSLWLSLFLAHWQKTNHSNYCRQINI